MHASPRGPTPMCCPTQLCRPSQYRVSFQQALFVSALVLSLLSPSVNCADDAPPPIQHHVYYSASHVTSIALETVSGALYATDVVHGRIIHYNSSGSVAAVWYVTEPQLYSPTSVAYVVQEQDPISRLLYVADSTTAAIVKVYPNNGSQVNNRPLTIPAEMWECGVLLAELDTSLSPVYVIDRYRGYVAKLVSDQPPLWLTGALPAAANGSNVTGTYLSALTSASSSLYSSATVYVVDGAADRVVQMDPGSGSYLDPLVFPLPDFVTGIQAVSWTWCTEIGQQYTGCLWVMYQPSPANGTETGVVAVSVLNGTVVHSWTVQAAAGADSVTAAAEGSEQRRQQQAGSSTSTTSSTHILSPAMRAIGQGIDSDPFLVYLAEADPAGPGHVIVVRDENGAVVRRYDAIPPQYDLTGYAMHAFSSVQADSSSCTLWLMDVDNGGLLVRAAEDGTILQSFTTPALFTAAVVDYSSDTSSPSLVLLSMSGSEWQLWRFHPATGMFTQLNTTGVQQQYGSSGMVVGGLSVDSAAGASGRLVVSLTSADALVLLQPDGQIDPMFNASGQVVRPAAVTFTNSIFLVVLDRSGPLGAWYIKSFETQSGELLVNGTLPPPVSQPLALMYDEPTGWLWMSDANGLLFQLNPATLDVVPGGIYRPMPAAYNMLSVSMDVYGTVYATDLATRRLILLFVGAEGQFRPSSKPCNPYPILPSSTSSSSSSSSSSASSSSSSSTGSVPDSDSNVGGLSPWLWVVVGASAGAVILVLICVVLKLWLTRRGWPSERSDSRQSDERHEVYRAMP